MRLSGKVSIDCGAIFKVGSCECLSFASIPYAVWWVDGCWVVYIESCTCRADEREEGRAGRRERVYVNIL